MESKTYVTWSSFFLWLFFNIQHVHLSRHAKAATQSTDTIIVNTGLLVCASARNRSASSLTHSYRIESVACLQSLEVFFGTRRTRCQSRGGHIIPTHDTLVVLLWLKLTVGSRISGICDSSLMDVTSSMIGEGLHFKFPTFYNVIWY